MDCKQECTSDVRQIPTRERVECRCTDRHSLGFNWRPETLIGGSQMGFDFDRSDATKTLLADESGMNSDEDGMNSDQMDSDEGEINPAGDPGQWAFDRALSRNLVAERFAIDAYRTIAAHSENYDKATLRLVKVALAVEEEHVQILSAIIHNLRNLPGAPAA
jgi:hypothetical protein